MRAVSVKRSVEGGPRGVSPGVRSAEQGGQPHITPVSGCPASGSGTRTDARELLFLETDVGFWGGVACGGFASPPLLTAVLGGSILEAVRGQPAYLHAVLRPAMVSGTPGLISVLFPARVELIQSTAGPEWTHAMTHALVPTNAFLPPADGWRFVSYFGGRRMEKKPLYFPYVGDDVI